MQLNFNDSSREEIYNRFVLALIRLKRISKLDDPAFPEVANYFFGQPYTESELIHDVVINDFFLIELTVLTALLEACKTWQEFEVLRQKQYEGERELMIPDNNIYYTDFDPMLFILRRTKEN